MAKYWLVKNPDGTFSIQAQLKVGKRVLFQTSDVHFDKRELRTRAVKVAEAVQVARHRHNLVRVDPGVREEIV